MHFIYWDLMRKGKPQVEIAHIYQVSRQAVNKSIKVQNHKVMVRLLELARSIGALVEWQDENKGLLVGIIPQLEDRICFILVDANELYRVFYSNLDGAKGRDDTNLIQAIQSSLDIKIPIKATLEQIIATLVNS